MRCVMWLASKSGIMLHQEPSSLHWCASGTQVLDLTTTSETLPVSLMHKYNWWTYDGRVKAWHQLVYRQSQHFSKHLVTLV
jgi:hypothetical protein